MIRLLHSEGQRRTQNCSRFPTSISAYWSRESSVLHCCRLTEVSRFSFWFLIWVTRTLQGNMSAFTRRHSFFPEPYVFSFWLRFQINSLGLWGDKFCLLSFWWEELEKLKLWLNADIRECTWEEMKDWHLPRPKKKEWRRAETSFQDTSRLIEATWLNWVLNLEPLKLFRFSLFYLAIYKGNLLPKQTSSKPFSPFPWSETTGNS